jgi:non-specific serine/threonine protein kinase
MALPYLVKRIYNNGSDEVVRRGKKIHASGAIDLLEYDELVGNIVFRVKDDGYHTYYKVYINQFRSDKTLSLRCSCPYNLTEVCRHKAAALLHLQDLLDRNMLKGDETSYNQKHTVVKMKQLDLKMLKMMSSQQAFDEAEEFLRTNKANIIDAKNETVIAEINFENQVYKLLIRKNEERNFDTSCDCNTEISHPLCSHKIMLFLQLLTKEGANYFDSIRNWDAVKNKLLSLYGYSLNDDLTGKFEFIYKDGRPFLRVLDANIKRVTNPTEAPIIEKPTLAETQRTTIEVKENQPIIQAPTETQNCLGVIITEASTQYPFIEIEVCQGIANQEANGFVGKIEKLDINKYIETENFTTADKLLLQQTRKLVATEVSKFINRNSPFGGVWENIIQQQTEALPEDTKQLINEYLHPKIKRLLLDREDNFLNFYLPSNKLLSSKNIQHVTIEQQEINPYFIVKKQKNNFEIECRIKLPLADVNLSENECSHPFLFKYNDIIFNWEKTETLPILEKFVNKGLWLINAEDWQEALSKTIIPLSKEYNVDFENIPKAEIKNAKPTMQVWLKEKGDYLIFEPVFQYNGLPIKTDDKEKIILHQHGELLIINRNISAEQEFMQRIHQLHSNFTLTNNQTGLALKGNDVLKNNWFFLFMDAMKESNTTVFGFEMLRNYKFNTSKPSTKIYISSNTDWFDARVEIEFGGQKITVADVKKALANKQQFVPLADGTLGILPEDWIRKYSLLFKVGEGKQEEMRISKFQFSVIEDLYNNRNEEELFIQLEEKYDKLKYNYEIKKIPAPKHLKKILRPYQVSGLHWLNYLREVNWGGILADDMGLGKTVQALSFLHHLKQEKGTIKALVVCPTTLLFNWQNEINKFTPELSFYVHHGGSRQRDELKKPAAEVIITTYGTLRSDIKELIDIPLDYVILDESQAIKNPSSKVTKAACLLNAKNRLCLSGTPLQNNTFDIFAQMNFLNPGMLGSQEFFKNEFAVPIDKFNEKEQKDHLRKLLYPFILRRTKEQVAKDLPEKQEMVLFCEMGEEQRKIYDAYRNDFRDKIMGVVQEMGIQKSQLTILQGLMKLRQICDSPAILKEAESEKYPNESVKLEELGREITENISNHKALVFSQFLGMLALIKQRLNELGVKYEYFDGSTSTTDREKAINNFQNNEECRVFLISLKAGGVGLNLTAADYVYLVDPWWNPAVEQQAIDRTHRIGQTKNIFAYRMICTDTVEDKILKLQEKKKVLAKDLITDDEGFVKTLTKEDVEYLFS